MSVTLRENLQGVQGIDVCLKMYVVITMNLFSPNNYIYSFET